MIAGTLLLVGMENKSMSLSCEEENKTDTPALNFQESKQDSGNPAPHLYAVGNAHIDLAWQWRWRETIETACETFTNALNLMEQNPDFIFAQDQAALYEGIEQHYPKVFERIREAVLSGQWQVVGGKWCESTMELANEESTIRQYLYGTRYFKDRFGISVDTDWEVEGSQFLPTFPQVMAQAGIRYAVLGRSSQFHKLRPPLSWWKGLDGSAILMAWLASVGHPLRAAYDMPTDSQTVINFGVNVAGGQNVYDLLYLYGRGDHGGGPTQQNLAELKTAGDSEKIDVTLNSPLEYFQKVQDANTLIPTMTDKMFLSHGGSHTTCVETKVANRQLEHALYELETLATLVHLSGGTYPQQEIERLWKDLLFLQFHDIAWGTTTYAVYRNAQEQFADIKGRAARIAGRMINSLPGTDTKNEIKNRLAVFNFLPDERQELAYFEGRTRNMPVSENGSLAVFDQTGNLLPTQILKHDKDTIQFMFDPGAFNGISYKTFEIQPIHNKPKLSQYVIAKPDSLENEFVRINFDRVQGHITSIIWKIDHKEIPLLPSGMACNVLYVAAEIKEADVWNGFAGEEAVPINNLESMTISEEGPLQAKITMVRQFNNSRFEQSVSLRAGDPMIRFNLKTDWHEPKHRLMVRIPFDYSDLKFDLPFGVGSLSDFKTVIKEVFNVEVNTGADLVKEIEQRFGKHIKPGIFAQEWVDLINSTANCALLNKSRYGFDLHENAIEIVVLRSPSFLPEPDWLWQPLPEHLKTSDPEYTDIGIHELEYALFPHEGDWRSTTIDQMARAFNAPLCVTPFLESFSAIGEPEQTLIRIEPNNINLCAVKKSEDAEAVIVRIVENAGLESQVCLHWPRTITTAEKVSIIEERMESDTVISGNTLRATIKPHEIASFRITSEKQ